ncbi:MAG: hypothetical protein AAGI69_29320 [Cyanobacteria bacterium P01_H01_bin.21]
MVEENISKALESNKRPQVNPVDTDNRASDMVNLSEEVNLSFFAFLFASFLLLWREFPIIQAPSVSLMPMY